MLAAAVAGALSLPIVTEPASGAADTPAPDPFQKELAEWKAGRTERLHSPTGWLTLIGLDWLKEGENAIGSAPGAVVKLPADPAPAKAGRLTLTRGKVTFQAEPSPAFAVP